MRRLTPTALTAAAGEPAAVAAALTPTEASAAGDQPAAVAAAVALTVAGTPTATDPPAAAGPEPDPEPADVPPEMIAGPCPPPDSAAAAGPWPAEAGLPAPAADIMAHQPVAAAGGGRSRSRSHPRQDAHDQWSWDQHDAWWDHPDWGGSSDAETDWWNQGGGDDPPRRRGNAIPEVEGDAAMAAAAAKVEDTDEDDTANAEQERDVAAAAGGPLDGLNFWPDTRDPWIRWVPVPRFVRIPRPPPEAMEAPHLWRLQWHIVGERPNRKTRQRRAERDHREVPPEKPAPTGDANNDDPGPAVPVLAGAWGQPDRAALVAAVCTNLPSNSGASSSAAAAADVPAGGDGSPYPPRYCRAAPPSSGRPRPVRAAADPRQSVGRAARYWG